MADTRVFEIYPDIMMNEVRFTNRFGIELAGHLYLPADCESKKNQAIAVAGPFGGVKEMASGLYAQEFAKMGFVAMAFDQSFTGESGGAVRNAASTDINTEDFLAAVDYLGSLPYVDREKIGLMGICGLAGMAISAASIDTRIKAVATTSMYDLSRSIGKGMMDSYTEAQKDAVREYVSKHRWADVDAGSYSYGPHEMTVNENNEVSFSISVCEAFRGLLLWHGEARACNRGLDPVHSAELHQFPSDAVCGACISPSDPDDCR